MTGTSTFEVVAPGIMTSVQDLGRFGCAGLGVAPSGALDGFAVRVANLLVGNPESAAVLETTLMGLRLRALRESVLAVTGGDLQPRLGAAELPMWRSLRIQEGEVVAFTGPRSGLRAYLAVAGGFEVDPILGSRATNLASGFGGFEGRLLRKGDILSAAAVDGLTRRVGRAADPGLIPAYASLWRLRVVWGPQDDDFSDEGKRTFVSAAFTVSPDSDRTGIRLKGAAIRRLPEAGESIISEGIVSGTIQVPGDGQPIIILGETASGGYRKIATVISADLPLLGQITPGDEVAFEAVPMDQAVQALREKEGRLDAFRLSLR
jgi:biotin-dependent carboxylase-like uncharacterized protein